MLINYLKAIHILRISNFLSKLEIFTKLKKKKNCISISVFGYKKKEKYPIYVSKNTFKRHVDLLLIGEEGKRYYVLIKDFNTCMYDHILHRERKQFCHYYLQAFSIAVILVLSHVNWLLKN